MLTLTIPPISPSNETALHSIAVEFVSHMGNRKIFCFHGNMGSGKTTFIKAVCSVLQVQEQVASPSFAIINQYYSLLLQKLIYHFDFYRLSSFVEVMDLGIEEIFSSASISFIEWPEIALPLIPNDACHVNIECLDSGYRKITANL